MVVRRAGGEMPEHHLLGGAPAEQHRHLVLELLARHQEAVFGRALDGVAQGDADLGDAVLREQSLLQDKDGEQRKQQVTDVELGAAFHRCSFGNVP